MDRTDQERLNAYRAMWVFCFFDLPVTTPLLQKRANTFREQLKKLGFSMYQYSVYQRFCISREQADTQIRRVERLIPPEGHVAIMQVTDKQYGLILNLFGKAQSPMMARPKQLDFF